jgi:5-methylcytosine-specific restriction endonuclease McrA
MSWANRKDWHIDHIIPLSRFKFTSSIDPEFQAAWALSNLRPLWAKENLVKNKKRTLLL